MSKPKTRYWLLVPLVAAAIYAFYECGYRSREFWGYYRFLLNEPPIWDATPEQEQVVRAAFRVPQRGVIEAVLAVTVAEHLLDYCSEEERAAYASAGVGGLCTESGEVFVKAQYISPQVLFHEFVHAAVYATPRKEEFAWRWSEICPEKTYLGKAWIDMSPDDALRECFLEPRAAMSMDEDVAIFGQELLFFLSNTDTYDGPLRGPFGKAPCWGKMADVFLDFRFIDASQRSTFDAR